MVVMMGYWPLITIILDDLPSWLITMDGGPPTLTPIAHRLPSAHRPSSQSQPMHHRPPTPMSVSRLSYLGFPKTPGPPRQLGGGERDSSLTRTTDEGQRCRPRHQHRRRHHLRPSSPQRHSQSPPSPTGSRQSRRRAPQPSGCRRRSCRSNSRYPACGIAPTGIGGSPEYPPSGEWAGAKRSQNS